MKKIIFLFFAGLASISIAQNKLLTMEEAVVKQRSSLAPARLKQLSWIKDSDHYFFFATRNNEETLVIGDGKTGKEINTLTLDHLNQSILASGNKVLNSFPSITWINAANFQFIANEKRYNYQLSTKKTGIAGNNELPETAENNDVAEKTNYVAYTVDNNLYVYDGKSTLPVTNDKDVNIVNGKSVHREEFGIVKGTFWSPDGDLLAFYRMDQTMVTDYPIIDWTTRPAHNENIKYPMAGDKSHEVSVGVYNVQNGQTTFLKTGEPKDQYLTNIAWSPDQQHVYIAVLNREQNHLWLNSYNATTGLFEKTLFEERNEKYVHPMHPMVFVPGHPDQFIWQSERDGYNHLYLYSTSGQLLKQLTKGNWLVTDFAGFDKKGKTAFFTATEQSAITRNFYSVDLKSAKMIRLTKGEGTHSIQLSTNGDYFIDQFQSVTIPRTISLVSSNGKSSKLIFTAENPLKDYQLGTMKLFTIKSELGDDLYCRLYQPIDFDSTKKYPCIVYEYNGPGIQLINNSWNGGGDYWFQYMAEHGFVVFTVDGHGSTNRGLAFEQSVFRHLGVNEMKDQLSGVAYLKSLPYVDSNRMGLFGWSFGGFMTTSIMTRYPGVFKVAVAGGPVIDWSYYEVMYTERYMDTPQENPEGYKESNVLNYVNQLQGKLLVIHGAQDNTVVWQHSIDFIKKCVDLKKQVDYFVYPGHEHNVLGKDREHLYQKVTDYFMQNL